MVALDRDKAEFCYLLCRSLRATRVVEAGTSFGVLTLYLAAAVRDNQVENGVVIGTEHEPKKVEIAHANFKEAGLNEFVELFPHSRFMLPITRSLKAFAFGARYGVFNSLIPIAGCNV